MTAVDRQQLEAAIGRNADYYLRRFEQIDAGRRAGWNWPAFFVSTAWFSYRGLVGWAVLNFLAPWVALMAVVAAPVLGLLLVVAYSVVFFLLVPLYADARYYRLVKQKIAEDAAPASLSWSATWPFFGAVVGLISFLLPALVVYVAHYSHVEYIPRSQVREAISMLSSARTSVAEFREEKQKWPDNLKQVVENTSGRFTERVEITSGAGAAAGPVVITATIRSSDVSRFIAGKTIQTRSEDGKNWTCTRGAVNGVEERHLPPSCRP